MCSTAARTASPLFKIFGRLLCNNKVLQPFENRFSLGEIQTQRLHREFLPLNQRNLTSLFGAGLAYADHFDSELHGRNLPPSTSTDSRSLASLRLKQFGSKGPYCSNRRSMLLHPSSRVSRSRAHVRAG